MFLSHLDKWSPALQIRTVLISIRALLSAPNPDDPLANDVASQWKNNEAAAIETGNKFHSRIRHYYGFRVFPFHRIVTFATLNQLKFHL